MPAITMSRPAVRLGSALALSCHSWSQRTPWQTFFPTRCFSPMWGLASMAAATLGAPLKLKVGHVSRPANFASLAEGGTRESPAKPPCATHRGKNGVWGPGGFVKTSRFLSGAPVRSVAPLAALRLMTSAAVRCAAPDHFPSHLSWNAEVAGLVRVGSPPTGIFSGSLSSMW